MTSTSCGIRAALQCVARVLSIGALSAALSGAHAQEADVAGIKAADQAFYTALNQRDIHAMSGVWCRR